MILGWAADRHPDPGDGDVAQLARAPALQAGGRGFESHHLQPIARGALPETTALTGVSPNVGGHITGGDSALTTTFPFRSHCGLIGGTVMRRSAALTSHFPSRQGVDLSCQSVLRHAPGPRPAGLEPGSF